MRILHTADWHLGRTFRGEPLIEDQAAILDQVFAALVTNDVDVLIIAGDIFDRTLPPGSAVTLWNAFVARVYHETRAAMVVIAGNHDSGDRIGLHETLHDPARILIRGPLRLEERALVLEDEHGPVAFSALPYGEIYAARQVFGDDTIKTPHDVLAAQYRAARLNVPKGARWVIAAHAFVAGGHVGEAERALTVGGIETVPHTLFEGADYVALGHLHRMQRAGEDHIRYSGAPLAFGFDESGDEKVMLLVDIGAEGVETMTDIPFAPPRHVRTIHGTLAELEAAGAQNPSGDIIKAVLADEGELVDPLGRLRRVYPHIMMLEREKKERQMHQGRGRAEASLHQPGDVVAEFLDFVRGESLRATEAKLVDDVLAELARTKAGEETMP